MSLFRSFISSLSPRVKIFSISKVALFHTGALYYAARKGTRARKEGKKVKLEIKKVAWIPPSKQKKAIHISRKVDESNLPLPEDDIYMQKDYKMRIFQFGDAISAIRETHHPSMYNLSNAFVVASVEMNTSTHMKKIKYMDSFTHIVEIENTFDHGEDRSIMAFCKEPELTQQLQDMHLALVGSVDTIKGIERGTITMPDYQFVICNPKILADLMHIRGVFKRKLPSLKNQTLGTDLVAIAKRLQTGIKYSLNKDPEEQDFGYADFHIGTLHMSTEQLEDNLKRVVQDIITMRPQTKPPNEEFVLRILLWSEPSPEKFKIDLSKFVETPKVDIHEESDDEDDEVPVAQKG